MGGNCLCVRHLRSDDVCVHSVHAFEIWYLTKVNAMNPSDDTREPDGLIIGIDPDGTEWTMPYWNEAPKVSEPILVNAIPHRVSA